MKTIKDKQLLVGADFAGGAGTCLDSGGIGTTAFSEIAPRNGLT